MHKRKSTSTLSNSLGWYQSNPGLDHWKVAKKVEILTGTNDYRLTYMHIIQLEVFGYPNSNFTGCVDKKVYYNI